MADDGADPALAELRAQNPGWKIAADEETGELVAQPLPCEIRAPDATAMQARIDRAHAQAMDKFKALRVRQGIRGVVPGQRGR